MRRRDVLSVLVVLGIVGFAFSDDPAMLNPTKTARASGCAGRAMESA